MVCLKIGARVPAEGRGPAEALPTVAQGGEQSGW